MVISREDLIYSEVLDTQGGKDEYRTELRTASKSATMRANGRKPVYGFTVLVANHEEVSQITWLPPD